MKSRFIKCLKWLAGGITLFVLLIVGIGVVYEMTHPPPGVGRSAEQGYRNSQNTIEGLRRYSAREGRYPATLEELIVSGDLDELPMQPHSAKPMEYSLISWTAPYQSIYTLEFKYIGPGINECSYRDSVLQEARLWPAPPPLRQLRERRWERRLNRWGWSCSGYH